MDQTEQVEHVAAAHPDWVLDVPRGVTIVEQGAPALALFVAVSGRVVLSGRGDGRQHIVGVVNAGEPFGAVAGLADVPHDVTARALEPARLLAVTRDRLPEFFRSAPTVALEIARLLAEQLAAAAESGRTETEAPGDAPEEPSPSPAAAAAPAPFEVRAAIEAADSSEADAPEPEPSVDDDLLLIAPSLARGPRRVEEEQPRARAAEAAAAPLARASSNQFYTEQVTCPLCQAGFEARRIRSSSLNAIRRESDLHTIYEGVNPLDYAVDVCPQCGYAALRDDWETLEGEERSAVERDAPGRREAVSQVTLTGDRTSQAVLTSYLLALRCYDLRKADARRRATVLHRLAWCARDGGADARERRFLELARAEYEIAFRQDTSLSDSATLTLSYLLGDLALRLKRPEEAVRWFERTLRLDTARKHPEIERLTRDRWADARELYRRKSGAA